MLLPSPLTCDSSSPLPKTGFQTARFASPPLSPPTTTTHTTISNIYSTCRALQSMLNPPQQLPSPPTSHSATPFKLRLRSRKESADGSSTTPALTPRKKIMKRAPPRGANKRRRALDDDMDRDTCDMEDEPCCSEDENPIPAQHGPSTPKRMRFAPEILPLGLERSDFHDLRSQEVTGTHNGELVEGVESSGSGNEEWSNEDDRLLVELVLEKLKLTKSDWQDCARSLGKDRGSVGRRWKSLMGAGEVGLKSRPRRTRIHGTWR